MSVFNDGVLLIFTFLNDREWITVASVTRHWFHLASIDSKRIIDLIRGNLKETPIQLTERFSQRKEVEDKSLSSRHASQWSLAHRVVSLQIEGINFDRLSSVISPFPALATLIVSTLPDWTVQTIPILRSIGQQRLGELLTVGAAATFPLTLTSLTLSATPNSLSHLESICTSYSSQSSVFDEHHTQLIIKLASSLPSLTSLSLIFVGAPTAETLPIFVNLRSLTITHQDLTPELLCTFAQRMPQLESLSGRCHMMGAVALAKSLQMHLPLFPRLRSYTASHIPVIVRRIDWEWLCVAFSSDLTVLGFVNTSPFPANWSVLRVAYPRLNHLEFKSFRAINDELALLRSSQMQDRIERLHLYSCYHGTKEIAQSLLAFTRLTHLVIHDPTPAERMNLKGSRPHISGAIMKLFESPIHAAEMASDSLSGFTSASPPSLFLPSLVSLTWRERRNIFSLEWDSEKRINRISYNLVDGSIILGTLRTTRVHTQLKRPFGSSATDTKKDGQSGTSSEAHRWTAYHNSDPLQQLVRH